MITSRRLVVAIATSLVAVSLSARRADALPDPPVTGGSVSEREIVREAWYQVLGTFPHLRHCLSSPMPTVVIQPSNHVGIYDHRIDTIILRSGGFRLADAVHELAHHLDWECGFGSDEEDALFAASGLADHLRNSAWAFSPVEIFAETVVKLVLGLNASSVGGRVGILHPGPQVRDLVAEWATAIRASTLRLPGTLLLVPL